jgi:3-mercaptopyruvate sulfurtransferase SseA
VALKMMDKGFTKVYALKGGWREWQSRQLPVETK